MPDNSIETASASRANEPVRIALLIEYDGSGFSGWQRQSAPPLPTVQGAVEEALSRVADHPVRLLCAGRTDAGVHATAQVVHFDAAVDRGPKAWVRGGNSLLPDRVRIRRAQRMHPAFHARFSALSRRYRYVMLESDVAPALLAGQLAHVRGRLDVDAMQLAANALIGEHDFSAFRAAGCQSRSPFRCVNHIRLARMGAFVVLDIAANAFLQHMVRNIAGALIAVGLGQRSVDWLHELLESRDRRLGAPTASAGGLYLVAVTYPETSGLPGAEPGPVFLNADAAFPQQPLRNTGPPENTPDLLE